MGQVSWETFVEFVCNFLSDWLSEGERNVLVLELQLLDALFKPEEL